MASDRKAFLKELEAALGPSSFSTLQQDLTLYGQDWSGLIEPNPCVIVFPRTTEEVSNLLKLCSEWDVPVVPSGGRTGLSGGAIAAQGEVVLSLSRMNRIGEFDSAARTLRVQAGVTTEQVHEHCQALGPAPGLTWPVDFASKGSSHVGGNISTNAGGVRVIHYGPTRNWVQSIELVTMDGTIHELNGNLVKNNTGLDLRHLVIGSEGTLGVVTEATLRLTTPAKEPQVMFFAVRDMEAVISLYQEVIHGPFTVLAFECLSRACYETSIGFLGLAPPVKADADAFVLMEIDTRDLKESELESWLARVFETARVIDGVAAQSPRETQELWKIREGVAEAVMSGHKVYQHDVSVPISSLPEFSRVIMEAYLRDYPEFEVFIFGHIGDGNLHIFIRKPAAWTQEVFLSRCKQADGALFELIRRFRGSVSAEHGIGLLKKDALPYSRTAAEIELLRGIKKVFDPKGLLNPGKVF